MPDPDLRRITAFLAAFARRAAERTTDLPGGFAVHNDTYAHSHADNQVVIDGPVDPEALPGLVDEALFPLPHRMVLVLDDALGAACAPPLARAGYTRATYLVMRHTGPVPAGAGAREVPLEVLRGPLARMWHADLPAVGDDVVRHLVERREARLRGAPVVRFLASRAPGGEAAAWADLYLDPAAGLAQIEDLVTAGPHRRRGHADAVLGAALRQAADAGCTTRFLTADAADWPRHWYARRGFTPLGRLHGFSRC
ncbi:MULTISPECIES: GNAT family N-acetyltransferase [unclassified Streptomyces]|uniref:GNAT family N-acetyltransferase n=1 Tax=unclassified Streptomyces TaxID=2593676 RepID=UPI0008DD6C5D|nr:MULTISPECIES: GNAT family N-acetyltransferase [unclassified Streptomyces]OII66525.1 GNAT family N-acetyltransferase [Streptomyces sp. CC77]